MPTSVAPPAAPTSILNEEDGVKTTFPIPEKAYYVGGDDWSDSGLAIARRRFVLLRPRWECSNRVTL
jgi:hypothetical protein